MRAFRIESAPTVLALWGVVISAVYMLRAYRSVFLGELAETDEVKGVTEDLAWGHRVSCGLLVVALLAIGFYPRLFSDLLTF